MRGTQPSSSLVQMDNPDHFAYRKITQGSLLPQNLKALEARIREIARGFIDRMAEHGDRCDFARDVAFLYPLHVIMEVLGVPESDEPRMLKLTQELFGNADGTVPATFQVVHMLGWKPHETQQCASHQLRGS